MKAKEERKHDYRQPCHTGRERTVVYVARGLVAVAF